MSDQPGQEELTKLLTLGPEELEQQVFDLLLDTLSPSIAEALSRTALPHWFDEPIMTILLDEEISLSVAEVIKQIVGLSFIKPRRAGGYLLHEEVRARLLQPWHTERAKACRDLSQRLWRYFDELARQDDAPFAFQAETLYHDLAANATEAFARFEQVFETALEEWRLAQAEQILQLAQEQTWALNKTNRLWLIYHEAALALQTVNYSRALQLLSDLTGQPLPDKLQGRVLASLGSCLRKTGKKHEARRDYEKALTIQRRIDDSEGLADTLDQLADFELEEQNFEQAHRFAQEALHLAEALQDKRKIASILRGIGAIYRQSGDEEQALDYYQRSLEIRRELNDEGGIADCLNSLAFIHSSRGEYDQALANMRRALEMSERLGDLEGTAIQLQNLAGIHQAQGQPTEALEVYRRALTLKEQAGDVRGQGITLHEMGNVHQAQGNYKVAQSYLEKTLTIFEDQLGSDHPRVQSILEQIKSLEEATKQ